MILPSGDGVFLDHVGLFTTDMDKAAQVLEKLGFSLTPFTRQVNPDGHGGHRPTGTANRCAMFREGYLETLCPVEDTPLARQLMQATGRYEGLHLIALAVDDPSAVHARLEEGGFEPQPVLSMSRPVRVGTYEGEAAFSLVRVPPHAMPEGRIQYLRHHTPEAVWLPEFLNHPNHAEALSAILLCVDDPAAAAQRYARFTGRASRLRGPGWTVELERGRLDFVSPGDLGSVLPGQSAPALPFMAAAAIRSGDLDKTVSCLQKAGVTFDGSREGTLLVAPGQAAGMSLVFHDAATDGFSSSGQE